MSDRLAAVERTEEGGLIRFERYFPNSPDDVWSALTDADRLADWWPPFATNVHVDLHVGGTMTFDWPDVPRLEFRFLCIEKPTLLEHTHTSPGSWMRYELEPAGDGTRLRATYFVPDLEEAIRRGDAVGGHYGFDRLQAALTGRPTPFDPDAFANLQHRYAEQSSVNAHHCSDEAKR